MTKLIIRIDDVHPRMNWVNFKYITSELLKKNYTAILGVIPDNKDLKLQHGEYQDDFWDYIRYLQSKGFVIAQHGYQHLYDTFANSILAGKDQSEFSSHNLDKQIFKLQKGKSILSKQALSTDIFMAPGHHFDHNTLIALKKCDFKYITDGHSLWPYNSKKHDLVFIPQLFSRPHGFRFGIYTTCLHLDEMPIIDIDKFIIKLGHYSVISFRDAINIRHPLGLKHITIFVTSLLMRLRTYIRSYKKILNRI